MLLFCDFFNINKCRLNVLPIIIKKDYIKSEWGVLSFLNFIPTPFNFNKEKKMKFTEKEIKKKLMKDYNISKDWLDKHLTVINKS